MPAEALAILLTDGSYSRAHYAFVLATAAGALGRPVSLFATNAGCHALMANWSGLADATRDEVIRARGVAGLDELREAARELGVRLMVCEAGLRSEGIDPGLLMPDVEVTGVASFLEAARGGQVLTL